MSSLSDESSLDEDFSVGFLTVGCTKPPDTNFIGLKLCGVLVLAGADNLAGVLPGFSSSSLLSSDDDDESFFLTIELFADAFAIFAFLAGASSSESSSDDDDLPLVAAFPLVKGALTAAFF